MSSTPQDFARRVLDAFDKAGHATDEEVGDAGGPSTTTLAKYRKVADGEMSMAEPRGDVLRRIDQAARWKIGSARALWRQGAIPEPAGNLVRALELGQDPPPLGKPRRFAGMDGYVQYMAERLTDVEERLDMLTAEIAKIAERGGGDGDADDTGSAAATKMPLRPVSDLEEDVAAYDPDGDK